ncbi:MAG: kelch repeat-containing protein, partial [Chryseosolibacter sp.]
MKISKTIWSILVFGGITTSMFAQDQWIQKKDFPGPGRFGAAAFTVGGKGYIGTGSNEQGYLADLWEYDPARDTWSQKADFEGHARNSAAGFSLGNKGYFTSGSYTPGDFNWEWYNDLWEYDPSANDWTQKASYDALGRHLPVALTIRNRAYVGTGTYRLDRAHNAIYLADFWEYDPATDSWQQKANVPVKGRTSATGISIGNKAYVGLGYYYYDTRLKDWWEYDPAEDAWTRKGDFPGTQRAQALAYTLGDRGYVGGGGYYSPLKDFWEYDPVTDSWSRKADMLLGFVNPPATFSIGAKAYIATGNDENEQYTKRVFAYSLSLPGVQNFSVVDTRTGVKVVDFEESVALDVGDPDFRFWTIRANTNPERVGSVLFRIDDVSMNTENKTPYLLAGYRLRALVSGEHVLEAEAYTQRLGRGEELQSKMAVLDFVNKTEVNRFVVLDASGQEVQELRNGDVLNVHDPRLTGFNIGAGLTQSSYRGSVLFYLNGERYRNENQPPYLMVSGNRKWWGDAGMYTVSALPYSKKNSKGVPGVPRTVSFVIEDDEDEETMIAAARENDKIQDDDDAGLHAIIYPVPAKDVLYILVQNANGDSQAQVIIRDMQG